MTSAPIRHQLELPISSLADSRAKTSAKRVLALGSVRAPGAACSTNSCVSFAWWDRDTWSWKTSQRSLIEDWTSFSENWPKQGLMRNGLALRRQMWAPAISGTGGGALPTPRANSAMTVDLRSQQNRPELQPNLETILARMLPTPVAQTGAGGPKGLDGGSGAKLMLADAGFPRAAGAPSSLPTPTTNDSKNASLPPSQAERDGLAGHMLRDNSIPTGAATYLNPSFVEEMMGFPVGWTA
jgi:hypothetical protein